MCDTRASEDFRLPPQCEWDLRSSGILRSVEWVDCHRRFETICRPPSSMVKQSKRNAKKQAWPLKIRPIGSAEKSVTNYHFMLRNIPEECRCQVQAKLWTVTDVGNDGGHRDFFVWWVAAVTWAQPGRTLSLAFGQRLKFRCPCTDCTAAHTSYDITCKWMLQSVHTTLCSGRVKATCFG